MARFSTPTTFHTRGVASSTKRLDSEIGLRLAAATAATLVAIAGAQLVVASSFALLLAIVTLAGVPVSYGIRRRGLRFGKLVLSRPAWNSLVMLLTTVVVFYFLSDTILEMWSAYQSAPQKFWLLFGGGDSIEILVKMFLIFAAFRSFALLTDKDATLTTIPSFSVLLLLVPVHKGVEVVLYFVAWTFVATVLFALEHRSEQAASVVATVPSAAPGQSGRLAARSLATTLGLALGAAMALSAWLSSRDPSERSETETAINSLVSRLTAFALGSNGTAASGGPERQIDFSSGPALPTRNELWQVFAITLNGEIIQPQYWRLFTLSNYADNSWSQRSGVQIAVERDVIAIADWPLPVAPPVLAPNDPRAARFQPDLLRRRRLRFGGFPIRRSHPSLARQFGPNTAWVQQVASSRTANLGFAPLLPAPRAVTIRGSEQAQVRASPDGGVDISIIQPDQRVNAVSNVPRLEEYGFAGGRPPLRKAIRTPLSPTLSPAERNLNLALPAKLPVRVRRLAAEATRGAALDESNYRRALRLATEVQRASAYTLRPPAIPEEQDAADFFLFEGGRRGYCTYFAGALTVLCRAQGIPARLVSGFASPETNAEGGALIREANAHAWTEVWVENWGWALVDATPAADRGDNAPTWAENWGDWLGASLDSFGRNGSKFWPALLPVVLVLGFVALRRRGVFGRRRTRDETATTRREIARIYERATRPIARRFRPRAAWETPEEWRVAAQNAFPDVPRGPLQILTDLYARAQFGPRALKTEEVIQAQNAAQALGVWKPRGRRV